MTLSSKQIDDIGNLYENIICETDYEKLGKEVRSNVRKGLEYARDWSNKNIEPAISATADFARGLGMKGSFVMGPGSSIPIDKLSQPKPSQPKPSQPKPSQPAITKTTPIKDSGREAGEWLAPSRGSSKAADPVVRAGGSYGFFGPTTPAATSTPTRSTANGNVRRGPRGGVIVNQVEVHNDNLVVEAPAQVAPITGKAGKEWMQKNKQGKWVPITDPSAAKKASARWKIENDIKKLADDEKRTPVVGLDGPPKLKPNNNSTLNRRPSAGTSGTRPPAATKPAPTRQAPAPAQTGDRAKDTATWAKANPQLAARVTPAGTQRGTGQSTMAKQAAELRGMQKASQERQAAQSGPMYSSPDVKSKMSSRTKTMLGLKDSYDIVLDYLLSQGHVDTLEEALYVMMEMDAENIRSIVEGVMPEPINPAAHKAAQKTQKIYNLGKGTNNPNEAQSALKRTGPQLPGV
jgi:hypothetical protein